MRHKDKRREAVDEKNEDNVLVLEKKDQSRQTEQNLISNYLTVPTEMLDIHAYSDEEVGIETQFSA